MQYEKLTRIAQVATGADLFYTHYALYVLQKLSKPDKKYKVDFSEHFSGMSRIKLEWKLAKGLLQREELIDLKRVHFLEALLAASNIDIPKDPLLKIRIAKTLI